MSTLATRLRRAGVVPRAVPRLLPRLGLRARITIAFAVGALVMSAVLAGATLGLTRQNLLDQRESSATARTYTNAETVSRQLPTQADTGAGAVADPADVLASLQTPLGSNPVLLVDDRWFPRTPEFGEDVLPAALRDTVRSGQAARMRFDLDGTTQLAVGVPLESIDGAYFEIVSLKELEDTLESISISLLAAAILSTLAGAGIGWWAARRVLRPLRGIGEAAHAIATGRLETRVEASDDADLATLADSFNEMASALEERIQRDARFASNVSHELRSPLMTLAASIEVLENQRDDMPDRARAALDLMVADIERFRQLVEDLLEISRFDAGVMHLDLEEVRVDELVIHAVTNSTDIDMPVDIDADLAGVVVRADKRRLSRVIANLLDNAGKYGKGASRVELRKAGNAVLIAVEDDGPGVVPEDREAIFFRFNRGTSAGHRRGIDGVGLGLALVAEHIRLHGGEVWVEDRADGQKGARFVIELPAETPA
ncbi:MAG TPA: HAMP domain-containing sensor histidine kinase [Acidimicrobiales bacterium]|nr:HAMP domain-containing sensor histidine kinase [Acidimicrobiales bacterium]